MFIYVYRNNKFSLLKEFFWVFLPSQEFEEIDKYLSIAVNGYDNISLFADLNFDFHNSTKDVGNHMSD